MMPKQRVGNQYYIPHNSAVCGTLANYALRVHRVMRKNREEDVEFEVRVGV